MNKKISFIGAGNMGYAMIRSIWVAKVVQMENVFVYDVDREKLLTLKEETGISITSDEVEAAKNSDIIVLAVKPNMVEDVLNKLKTVIDTNKILVSVAVGIPIKVYKRILGEDKKVIRTLPNTPAMVGEGMTLFSYKDNLREDEVGDVKKIFECFGKVEVLDEKLMSEVTALTSSSPAYVFMFIEAMADGAVLSGIPRNIAYRLAAQAVLGAAKMVLDTNKHPGELKDQVCSPGGTTIEAVKTLEKNAFRFSVIEAMDNCTKRAREIGKMFD